MVITRVDDGKPAAKAGVRVGMRLLQVCGAPARVALKGAPSTFQITVQP
eukprot:gene22934-23403_t